jgi:hypothetical protein
MPCCPRVSRILLCIAYRRVFYRGSPHGRSLAMIAQGNQVNQSINQSTSQSVQSSFATVSRDSNQDSSDQIPRRVALPRTQPQPAVSAKVLRRETNRDMRCERFARQPSSARTHRHIFTSAVSFSSSIPIFLFFFFPLPLSLQVVRGNLLIVCDDSSIRSF